MFSTIQRPPEKTKFKRDNYLRSQLFTPDSFKHAGRANLNLLSALLERVPVGAWVVDPMGGTGSILIATDYQHPVITGELETHWARVSEANRQSICGQRLIAASTPALCCQWNAARLPLAAHSIPAIITSPPYWDMFSDWHIKSKGLQDAHELYGPAYGLAPANLGNIHIYEAYLRAMAAVYRECGRVLAGPGAILALIIKDRVHQKRVVPIVRDTLALVTALGFNLVTQIERACIPSLHRHVNRLHHPDAPTVDHETALVFAKDQNSPGPKRFAIVQAPKLNSAPSSQLYQKALAFTQKSADQILVLATNGLQVGNYAATQSPKHPTFQQRKTFAFTAAADLVTKFSFGAGDIIEFHGSMAYGQYLRERLITLGGQVVIPTEGLNLGQKLRWYTKQEEVLAKSADCRKDTVCGVGATPKEKET